MKNIDHQQLQLQELLIDWYELEVYRNLNGLPFNFGTGLIEDNSRKNEDAYWKMQQRDIESAIENLEFYKYPKRKRNIK